jgi:hypothetical protein
MMKGQNSTWISVLALSLLLGAHSSPAHAQWSTTYEQFYYPGSFNWTFRREYPAADRLFAAFDYGHAILYERLYRNPEAPASMLEEEEYNFITKELLVHPPRLPLEEGAIEIAYAKIAPEAKAMFDWAHLLHRQIYDVLASEEMSGSDKDVLIAKLVRYYKSRSDLAFSSLPKNMDLMEGQPYSLAFRQGYPKFNGLIWGYHWLQVGLYEPLMLGRTQEERQAGVAGAVTRFRQMLENAPDHMPRIMPMTAAIAPTFAKRYPEAAIIFDNLHGMHDVISDILASTRVPHDQKRAAILEAARRYRDSSSYLMSVAEWATMGQMMGVENMGGPAANILPGWPTPTLPRGIRMADAMKQMPGMAGDSSKAHAGHDMSSMAMPATPKRDTTAAMGTMPGMQPMSHGGADTLMQRMMADPVIHQRMMADTTMRRLMQGMPAIKHDTGGMQHMSHESTAAMPAHAGTHATMHMPMAKSSTRPSATKRSSSKSPSANRAKSSTATKSSTSTKKQAKAKPATKTPAAKKDTAHHMPGMNMKGMPNMKP